MCRDEVADEEEDAHDDVLGHRDDIRARDLEDLDTLLDGSIEVDVVRADSSGDTDLQVLRLNQLEMRDASEEQFSSGPPSR